MDEAVALIVLAAEETTFPFGSFPSVGREQSVHELRRGHLTKGSSTIYPKTWNQSPPRGPAVDDDEAAHHDAIRPTHPSPIRDGGAQECPSVMLTRHVGPVLSL